ncbi:MAG: hypothetical protein M1819_000022 [Sarea resinae]|nr:MAG: hypothetical protein M1819_000022 [Sarea resinae]
MFSLAVNHADLRKSLARVFAVLVLLAATWTLKLYYDATKNPWRSIAAGYGENQHEYTPPFNSSDKVIVIAKTQREDTNWVADYLPDWQRAIYVVDDPAAEFHTPVNKGREAMPYLTYIIDNYDSLPRTIVFLHSHRNGWWTAWHNDAPYHDNVIALRNLRLDYVESSGYVNLRCSWSPGCEAVQLKNQHITPAVWKEFFQTDEAPPQVGSACCAQFAVSREQILKRPIGDYQRYRQWVFDSPLNDAKSGRVMEYMWHVIFGKDAVE